MDSNATIPRRKKVVLDFGGVSSQSRSRFERATWSLATFVRSHRSLRSLTTQRSASLRSLTPFTGSLTHFAHSLVGQLKFLNVCSRCYRVSREQARFWRSLETRPNLSPNNGHLMDLQEIGPHLELDIEKVYVQKFH